MTSDPLLWTSWGSPGAVEQQVARFSQESGIQAITFS